MTGEPEMIQLESDHGGVEVQERSCTSFQLEDPSTKSKRKRKMADKDRKKKQVKKIKKEPVEVCEHIDVVLSSEDFNADEFLNGITEGWKDLPGVAPSGNPISQPYKNPSPPQVHITDTEILYYCPLHESEALQKKKTVTKYGEWQYYKCPVAKCFVTCGVDCVEYYIDSTKHQLHEFYLENELNKMRCYCERPLIMSQSRSEKNPGRLFFKCSKRICSFFQWVDQ